jgi:hypothetical protein
VTKKVAGVTPRSFDKPLSCLRVDVSVALDRAMHFGSEFAFNPVLLLNHAERAALMHNAVPL